MHAVFANLPRWNYAVGIIYEIVCSYMDYQSILAAVFSIPLRFHFNKAFHIKKIRFIELAILHAKKSIMNRHMGKILSVLSMDLHRGA